MKKIFISLAVIFFVQASMLNSILAQEKTDQKVVVETDIDRPGKDYKRMVLDVPNLTLCIEACKNDPKCKAFTYVRPGVQGTKAVCYLKSDFSNPVKNANCISGYKQLQDIALIKGTKMPTSGDEQVKVLPVPLPNPDNKNPSGNDKVSGLPIPLPNPSAIPINLPHPKPVLASTRAELLQEAIEIPDLNKQLTDIANSKGLKLPDLMGKTSEGKTANSKISEGQSVRDLSNVDPAQKHMQPADYDWSGGIQLTPVNFVSKSACWSDHWNNLRPIAVLVVTGIELYFESLSLEQMEDLNTVALWNGTIYTKLHLPNKYEQPYLISIDATSDSSLKETKLECEIYINEGFYDKTELQINSGKDKYVGILDLAGQQQDIFGIYKNSEITLSIKMHNFLFSGITITQL